MSTKMTRRKIFALLMVSMIAAGQTGCQSGWKMPSTSIFPWSKKPSESTLAGSNPSLTAPTAKTGSFASGTGTPSSPASNNTPALLSSANTRTASPYGGVMGRNQSTIPTASDFTTPQANPTAGLAANANGYQTGPYSMGGVKTGQTAPSPYGANNNVAAAQPSTGFAPATGFNTAGNVPQGRPTNPGLATSAPPQQPQFTNQGLPGAQGFAASNGLPVQSQPGMGTPNNFAGNAAFGNPGLPPAQGMPNAGMPNAGMNAGNFAPAVPVGMSSTNMAALPPATPTFSMPNAGPTGHQAPIIQAATASYSGASPYRPGSTSRSTAYDFSKPAQNGATNVPHTATGLPPATQPNVFR
jgi:hypothetical protein